MDVTGIDHLVLYVEDVERSCEFYADELGIADVERFDGGRIALDFGTAKLNLHRAGEEYVPHADEPTPGATDFCLLVEGSVDAISTRLEGAGIPLVEGPVDKVGARGPLRSVYVRDPDGNLVELARAEETG